MGLRCKRCGSEEQVKNGLMRSKQRYLCKACGLNFTDTPARGKPLAMKATAVLLYVSGLSMNRTAKLLGVSTPTIQAWLEQFASRLRAQARAGRPGGGDRARRDVALPQKKSEPLWIWKAWDRASGQLVDWECGDRDKATCQAPDRAAQALAHPALLHGRLRRLRRAVADRAALCRQGRDPRHRARQRPAAALAGPLPTPLHRGLEDQAHGGRQPRPIRLLRREQQDRRPAIYASLKPSAA